MCVFCNARCQCYDPGKSEDRIDCKNAVSTLHQRGFTNYFDAYINYLAGTALYPYLKELDEKGELGINAATTYTVRSFEAKAYREKMDILIKEGEKYRTAHFDPLILKLFADGVVESKTGWALGEYPNAAPGQEHGNIVWTPEEFKGDRGLCQCKRNSGSYAYIWGRRMQSGHRCLHF